MTLMVNRLLTTLIYGLSGLTGLLALAYPFLTGADSALPGATPLLTAFLLLLCLGVLLLEIQGEAVNAKMIAALGILVAVTAVLRFVEVAIPGPGGFSPIFAPIVLAGYVFGARFGFLLGALALLSSALITGGVGPWLPYQMWAAGWVGLTAGWLPHPARTSWAIALLAVTGFLWGILYGLLLNLTVWPYLGETGAGSWQAGLPWSAAITRYLIFYAATSALWDLVRAGGTALLLIIMGAPTLRALLRFRDRFHFEHLPVEVR